MPALHDARPPHMMPARGITTIYVFRALDMLQPDMWSGWGIRTLSSKNPAYNPFSYHLGSVWPHDNGIIAAGCKHYGLINETNKVIRGVFDAARRFDAYRLPEIYAGLRREGKRTDFPSLYPGGANIPQAWASGSIFQMLQTIFGLRADAPHGRLYVHPTLPTWLPEIELRHLRVGASSIDLRFWREGEQSRWEVCNITEAEDHPTTRTPYTPLQLRLWMILKQLPSSNKQAIPFMDRLSIKEVACLSIRA